MTDFAERQHELRDLAATPKVDPELLVAKIWPVVNGVIEQGSPESVQLLDDTKPLVEKLVSHPDLRLDSSGYIHQGYFSANMLRGSWGMLSAYAHGRPITAALRKETCHHLGNIISDATYGSFNLEQMEPRNAQRVSQVAMLQLLQRNTTHSQVFGLPSDPTYHNPGKGRADTTFNICAWSPSLQHLIPLAVQTRVRDEMHWMPRFRNVLLVGLGELAYGAAARFPLLREQSRPRGSAASVNQAKRWLINHAARMLAIDSGAEMPLEHEGMSPEERQWLAAMTNRLFKHVNEYRPPTE